MERVNDMCGDMQTHIDISLEQHCHVIKLCARIDMIMSIAMQTLSVV